MKTCCFNIFEVSAFTFLVMLNFVEMVDFSPLLILLFRHEAVAFNGMERGKTNWA